MYITQVFMKRANFHHQQRLFQDVFQGPPWNGGGGSWDHSARHGHRDPSIAALILDSPFASLEMVVRELIVACRGL